MKIISGWFILCAIAQFACAFYLAGGPYQTIPQSMAQCLVGGPFFLLLAGLPHTKTR